MGDPLSTRTIDGGDTDEGLGVGNVGGFSVSYRNMYTENNYYILNTKDQHRDNLGIPIRAIGIIGRRNNNMQMRKCVFNTTMKKVPKE
ncbi:hypothetical protein Tco_0922482 [Tanacetum coccineum]|uniref:Uncharacterized protein n=1 Tax=Tanacetum coccineum TaxID=301880 RepID=A0ABQ5CZ61_9ASTR